MKNTGSCFETQGRVVVVVKLKPRHNRFKSIVERSRVKSQENVYGRVF